METVEQELCETLKEGEMMMDTQHGGDYGQDTYQQAVQSGFYQRDAGGLKGKYDNVRRYWEDQLTRYALHDFVDPMVERKKQSLSRIRVVDLGAGSGEGYEILTTLKRMGQCFVEREIDVLPNDMIGCYRGVDISPAMVLQGNKSYEHDPKVQFMVGDLSQGIGALGEEPAFDIYFSSYGSLSHLQEQDLTRMLQGILEHFEEDCILLAEMVGRYSFEWQSYWDQSGIDATNMRQYSMSYLYPPEMLDKVEVERFPMRYWGAREFDELVHAMADKCGVKVTQKQLTDRSIVVGRHMDTGEFNPHARPIRAAVNSLHEFNCRTDLNSLIFDYTPHPEFPALNDFFEKYQMAWNGVVYAAIEALLHWDDPEWLSQPPSRAYPPSVQEAIKTIRNVVKHIQWFRMGDPLANVVEPQLGYILRNMEMSLQPGLGVGHGLLAIYEFAK